MTYRRFNDSPDDSSIGSVCGSDQHQDETVTSTNTDLLTLAHCSRSVCGESTSSRSTSYPHTSYHDPNSFSASVTHAKSNTWKKTIAIDIAIYVLVIAYFSLWGCMLVANCMAARKNNSNGQANESHLSQSNEFPAHGNIAQRFPLILGASQVVLLSILFLWILRTLLRYITIQCTQQYSLSKHSRSSSSIFGRFSFSRLIGQFCCFCCCHECLLCWEKVRRIEREKQDEQAAYHMFFNTNTLHTLDTDADVF